MNLPTLEAGLVWRGPHLRNPCQQPGTAGKDYRRPVGLRGYVENLTNKSKGEYAYTVVDIGSRVGEKHIDGIRAIGGVLRVRHHFNKRCRRLF